MKKLCFIIPLLALSLLSLQAQAVVDPVWVVYSDHTSSAKGTDAIPELTYASESIEAEGKVIINKGKAATFRTSQTGQISLLGHFQVEKGAFFLAHKGKPATEKLDKGSTDEPVAPKSGVINTKPEISVMRAFPNPFVDYLSIDLILETDSQLHISLFDANGKLVREVVREKRVSAGRHQARINTSQLVPGVYFCEILTDTQQFKKTVVRAK